MTINKKNLDYCDLNLLEQNKINTQVVTKRQKICRFVKKILLSVRKKTKRMIQIPIMVGGITLGTLFFSVDEVDAIGSSLLIQRKPIPIEVSTPKKKV
jgi:hypothetical protein